MKVLIIMEGFFPGKKYGGPPVSVDNFCSLLNEDECFIVTLNHDLGDYSPYQMIEAGWNDRENCKVLYLSDREYNTKTFRKILKELEPNILYLQSLFQSCVLPCLFLARQLKIPVLIAPRGELCTGALQLKKYKKLPYIELINLLGLAKDVMWQSTSEDETAAIKRWMKADVNTVFRLDNIPSIPKVDYQRREKKRGEGHFVFLSRIHPKKNLLAAIKYFSNITGSVTFDIIGPIEEQKYWEICQNEIRKLPNNVKVEYKGLVEHDEIHEVFSQYDAFVFPTLSENYGHVIAESLIVGTPVIISDQTPWINLQDVGVGWDIDLNDFYSFVKAIQSIVDLNAEEMRNKSNVCKEYCKKKIDIKHFYSQYSEAIKRIAVYSNDKKSFFST